MDLLLNDSNDDGSSSSDDDDDNDEKMSDNVIAGLGNKAKNHSDTIQRIGNNDNDNYMNASQQQRPQHESSTISSMMNLIPISTVPSSSNRMKNNTIQINNNNDSAATTATTTTTTKGKRLLSLASVLPPHILAALTKQQQRYRNGTYDEDDDDDDDDEEDSIINNDDGIVPQHKDGRSVINRSKQNIHAKAENSNTTEPKISGKGSNNKIDNKSSTISSFLKDLHQVGFTNDSSNNTKIDKTNISPTNTTQIDDDQSQQLSPSETTNSTATATTVVSKLGEAFLNSTTTTIKSNHAKSMTVQNIHDNDGNGNDARQSLLDNHQSSSSDSNRIDSSNIQSSTTAATAINTTNDSYHLSRPKRMIQAAPQVNAAPLSQQSMSQPLQVTSSIHELPIQSIEEQEQQRFLSRKEIERTLRRSGNSNVNSTTGQNNKMDDVWNNMEFTQTQEGVDPNMYAPNVIATAQQQQLTSMSSNASFIKHSTTHIYDPTLGTTVPYNALKSDTSDVPAAGKTVAMKGKGKNQINALLAQAVSLERERNEQQLQSTTIMTSKTTQQIHRANAKRKYGW